MVLTIAFNIINSINQVFLSHWMLVILLHKHGFLDCYQIIIVQSNMDHLFAHSPIVSSIKND